MLLLLLFALAPPAHSTTLATVGDSFADAFYFGLRARPELLKQNRIELIRWSRPSVGLARSDQFDYAGWLRDTADLGAADFCVVQIGTNDMQSIPGGAGKWLLFPSPAWQNAYTERVQSVTEILHSQRCRRVIWALQPSFEKSKFLSKNRGLINQLQSTGAGGSVLVEVTPEPADYARDGIHFNGPFVLKLADATIAMVTTWRDRVPETCFACHTRIAVATRAALGGTAALRIGANGYVTGAALIGAAAPRSVVPPRPDRRPAQAVARRVVARRRRHHG